MHDTSNSMPNKHIEHNHSCLSWKLFEAASFSKREVDIEFFTSYRKSLKNSESVNFAILKREIGNGSAETQYLLAECYRRGKGVRILPQKAYHYYHLAADQGHAGAQLQLGILYEDGWEVAQSEEMAFFYYQCAADQNHPDAWARLGLCYEEGIGTERSLEQAIDCYRTAAKQGSILGLYHLAKAYEMGNGIEKSSAQAAICYKKRFQLIQSAADMGNVEMQVLTALCFKHGEGVDPSPEASIQYFTQAAENNNEYAQYYLGQCYRTGDGVKPSIEKAIYYYTLAADQGCAHAQFNLGYLLHDSQRYSEAFHYFMCASSSSSGFYARESSYIVAQCLEAGCGIARNPRKAFFYYRRAAKAGHPKAQCRLGKVFYFGELGRKKSYERGLHYYTAAADNNHLDALEELAGIYSEGIGVEKSPEKANDLLRKRAFLLAVLANKGDTPSL
ncbi:MAG: sel1 repeat family protein [Verrucomicrobia bacterium]|nr:sel1 repeat family protein [Verrucomicrobiota bacterium]